MKFRTGQKGSRVGKIMAVHERANYSTTVEQEKATTDQVHCSIQSFRWENGNDCNQNLHN